MEMVKRVPRLKQWSKFHKSSRSGKKAYILYWDHFGVDLSGAAFVQSVNHCFFRHLKGKVFFAVTAFFLILPSVLSLIFRSNRVKPSDALHLNRNAIRRVVESHHASNARVFGSVLHGQDTDGSDLDILIDPTPETTLMDVATIQVELQRLLGVTVDVLTPKALPDSFRNQVLAEAVPV